MGRLVDLTGQRFGRLVVIRRDGTSYSSGNPDWSQPTWLCKCDCGNEKIVTGINLKQGCTRSCGCLRRETAVKLGKSRKGKKWYSEAKT